MNENQNNLNNQNGLKDSILRSIKKLLMIDDSYTVFDDDIIMHINSVLSILKQMGVGKKEGLTISDDSAVWGDFVDLSANNFNEIKSYVYLKVKLLFDPPQLNSVMESTNRQISELEYRLYTEAGGY